MPLKFAPLVRACGVAGALIVSVAVAAERKTGPIGATRQEVLAQFGEPRSQIVAGPREVLFFAKARVVLRDGRVVEFEEVVPEQAPAAPSSPAPTPGKSLPAAASASTAEASVAAPVSEAASSSGSNVAPSATPAATPAKASEGTLTEATHQPAAPEPEVQIKSVRRRSSVSPTPPSAGTSDSPVPLSSLPTEVATPPAPARAEPGAGGATVSSPAVALEKSEARPVAETAPVLPVVARPPTPAREVSSESVRSENAPAPSDSASSASVASSEAASLPAPAASTGVTEMAPAQRAESHPRPARVVGRSRGSADTTERGADVVETVEAAFTPQTYVIGLVTLVLGIGYLVWRRRQRLALLEVTSVAQSPFAVEQPVVSSSSRFTAELLGKLEWKRFQELVASYYNKTGVVAARTSTGPAGAVHIRVSWKGEQRPFACVHCIARPASLIGPQPIQALNDVLVAEDIRRGYIVTSGKFSVPARDYAEEKHITLLSGDIFVEKLNALPEPARSELLREATSGDFTTPVCPRCDVKMVRSASGTAWQCVQCGDQLEG